MPPWHSIFYLMTTLSSKHLKKLTWVIFHPGVSSIGYKTFTVQRLQSINAKRTPREVRLRSEAACRVAARKCVYVVVKTTERGQDEESRGREREGTGGGRETYIVKGLKSSGNFGTKLTGFQRPHANVFLSGRRRSVPC